MPLPDDVIEVLKAWKVGQDDEKTANKKHYNDQGYVFAWEDGRPLRTDYISKQFLKLVRAHGYEEGLTTWSSTGKNCCCLENKENIF